jgi:hypothetical protein
MTVGRAAGAAGGAPASEETPDAFGLFPLVDCTPCGTERLAFQELDETFELRHVCAVCGSLSVVVRHVDDSILSAQGLRVRAAEPIEAKLPKKTTGCSKSCSSNRSTGGGCGTSSGGCGTCSSGGCGTK